MRLAGVVNCAVPAHHQARPFPTPGHTNVGVLFIQRESKIETDRQTDGETEGETDGHHQARPFPTLGHSEREKETDRQTDG